MKSVPSQPPVSFSQSFRVWLKIALLSFGGPAAQISVMHRILVEEKKWISENRFLHALNYCMLLPGPEAQQLITYMGWLMHGWLGGLTAGCLFVLPGFLSILGLSFVYTFYHHLPAVDGAFFGLKAAVLAVVAEAVLRIGKKTLKNEVMTSIAALAFVGIFFMSIPFPLIILAAGLAGFWGGKIREDKFYVIKSHPTDDESETLIGGAINLHKEITFKRSLTVGILWLGIWFAPVALLILTLGSDHVLVKEALFFSKTAVVTFGGAYSVLSYIAQQAVHHYAWLQPEEMLHGLGMAETTPGPLIQVVQFVGFLGAYRNPAPFSPLTAALLGSLITTWVTYAPCFLWIFLGAPYIEHLRGNKSLNCALSAVTAAVVGVILNLALWFALHVLFKSGSDFHWGLLSFYIPDFSSWDVKSFIPAALAAVLLFRFHWNIIAVLGSGIFTGLLLKLFFS